MCISIIDIFFSTVYYISINSTMYCIKQLKLEDIDVTSLLYLNLQEPIVRLSITNIIQLKKQGL